jgi:hypothetical protein
MDVSVIAVGPRFTGDQSEMRNRMKELALALVCVGLLLPPLAYGQEALRDLSSVGGDIVFQDRYEMEIVQVPSGTAERVVAASQLSGNPDSLAALGDQAVFTIGTISNREVWFADGTDHGSYAIELPEGYTDVTVRGHVVRGERIYFLASPSFGVTDIWASDGSASGTERVVSGGELGLSQSFHELTQFGGEIAFRVFDDGAHRVYLLDDSAAGGARRVENLTVSTGSSRSLAALGSDLYVSGWLDGSIGLHRVDAAGQANQAWELQTVGEGNPVLPQELTASNNSIHFAASQGEGVALWRHQPGLGTSRLFDPSEEAEHMRGASNLTAADGRLYFFTLPWNPNTESFSSGWRLAVSDGTTSGTNWYWPALSESGISNAPNLPTAGLGSRLLFRADVTDGTAAGTYSKNYQGTSSAIRPDHTVSGAGGIWLTATNGANMAFAGFDDDDSFAVTDPPGLRYNNNAVNLARVDGLPWMIARVGFSGGWEIWRIAPEDNP